MCVSLIYDNGAPEKGFFNGVGGNSKNPTDERGYESWRTLMLSLANSQYGKPPTYANHSVQNLWGKMLLNNQVGARGFGERSEMPAG